MKILKKLLTILLLAALCLSLCAGLSGCGNKKTDPSDPNNGGKTDPGSDPSAAPAPETYVYASKAIPVKGDYINGLNAVACRDGRILASAWMKIGENVPEGATPEWEGQYDVYGMKLFWITLDGVVTPMEGYQQMETEDEDSSTYMNGMRMTPDGKLYSLETIYSQWYDGPDDIEMYSDEWYAHEYYQYMHYEENYFLRILKEDGSEESRIDLSSLRETAEEDGGYFYVNSFAVDADGRIVVNSGQFLFVLDGEGKLLQKLETDNWFENILTMKDGRVGVTYYGENGERFAILDMEKLALDTENAYSVTNAWNMVTGGGDYDFYYSNGSNLMGYRLADGKAEKVFNWINADVDATNVNNPFVLEDGRVAVLQTDWGDDYTGDPTTDLVIVSKVPASSLETKTVLTLATMSLDWNTQRMLVKFNRSNPDYRIELLDYSEYNTEEDYSAGQTKLNAEIMAGKMPDILNLNGLNSFGKMASKGLLLDLMPLLNEDPELKDQLFENVLQALMTDGKLYRTASGFYLNTVVGAASVVGDTPGWNLKQFEQALKSMPAGCDAFNQGTTRDSILSWGLGMEMNKLADWNTGKCAFDTPLFTDILKLAAQFPKDYDYENVEWEDDTERIASGRQMLMQAWISDFDTIQMYDAIFGGDATYIGFHTSEGVGSMFEFNDAGFAISAKCANKDAAWQFVRTLMTADYQQQNVWAFPTNKAAFDKKLEDAMTPQYMRDENGNYVLDENGNKIEEDRGTWGWGSMEIKITHLSEAQADKILDAIRRTDRVDNYDEELMGIITAECEAFFAGQKSAEDVGKLLQSKLTIYINEQR